MSEGTKAILTFIVIAMYIIGVVLLFSNFFGGMSSNNVLISAGLMVGATILGSIIKSFSNNE